MTGSRRGFGYETDDGQVYGVNKDESAAEATAGGVTLFPPLVAGSLNLPGGVKKRYVNTVLQGSTIARRFEIGRSTVFQALTAGNVIVEQGGGLAGGGNYEVLSKVGEKRSFVRGGDTGQTDGDIP
jgi:hypothetical protein